MRKALLKRVRPLVERLATDLTELAVRRVEAELERMTEAFSVALSAYQSNGAPDLIEAALGPDLARMLNSAPDRDTKPANVPPPAPAERPRVVRPPDARSGHSTDKRRSDGKRIGAIICSKCGYVGGNARGCGTAHETVTATEDLLEADATIQRDTKPDRFARIEAAAAARRAGGM